MPRIALMFISFLIFFEESGIVFDSEILQVDFSILIEDVRLFRYFLFGVILSYKP